MITSLPEAIRHANNYLKYETVVVSDTGDIVINMDVDEATQRFTDEGKKSFIVKGEIKPKQKKKKENVQSE